MNNFQKLSTAELQNIVGGRGKSSWWRNVQRGVSQFMSGLCDGLAGK